MFSVLTEKAVVSTQSTGARDAMYVTRSRVLKATTHFTRGVNWHTRNYSTQCPPKILIVGHEPEAFLCALKLKEIGLLPTVLTNGYKPDGHRGLPLTINSTRMLAKSKCLWSLPDESTNSTIIGSYTRMDYTGEVWGTIAMEKLAEVHGYPFLFTRRDFFIEHMQKKLIENEIVVDHKTRLSGLEQVESNRSNHVIVQATLHRDRMQPVGDTPSSSSPPPPSNPSSCGSNDETRTEGTHMNATNSKGSYTLFAKSLFQCC
eukprot:TRINITY_DN7605_c0_g1_i6.p1 TRINITY_DN7605_c0_g1~~TRINITY_DN7605_c0_g1_i6.p1  ORF type:complete len:260 (-),score=22.66 TRINITY_DN7605_c0_g1_i6:49-828(-)